MTRNYEEPQTEPRKLTQSRRQGIIMKLTLVAGDPESVPDMIQLFDFK
jgi:hypothetical protein